MSRLLKVDNLTLTRAGKDLFQNLSFELSAGQLMQIKGPNGCGKSSLLQWIAGILTDMNPGSNQDIWSQSHANKPQSVYLASDSGFFPELSIVQNINWLLSLYGFEEKNSQIEAALKHYDILHLQLRRYAELSSGQKMRASLSLLDLLSCQVWLLDEPFVALDQSGQATLQAQIEDFISSGGAVMLVTHQALGLPYDTLLEFE